MSADLVFVGLRTSFDASGRTPETGSLMLALLGYTLLLATTACVLIRLGDRRGSSTAAKPVDPSSTLLVQPAERSIDSGFHPNLRESGGCHGG